MKRTQDPIPKYDCTSWDLATRQCRACGYQGGSQNVDAGMCWGCSIEFQYLLVHWELNLQPIVWRTNEKICVLFDRWIEEGRPKLGAWPPSLLNE